MHGKFQDTDEASSNLALGIAHIRDAKKAARLIDKVAASSDDTAGTTKRTENTVNGRYIARRKTRADYLAEHPGLIPVLKAMGKL